jgi:hypothetical protein
MMHRERSRATTAVVIGATVGAVLLVHAGGCGDDGGDALSSGDAAVSADVRPDRRGKDLPEWEAGEPSMPPSPLPGWKPLSEYDPACGFYYATEAKYLPPPITWEPCAVVVDGQELTDAGVTGPSGTVCERMATPWATSGQTGTLVHLRSVHVEAGRALLLLSRTAATGGAFTMIAEADGPVHTALYKTGRCATGPFDEARFGHFMQRIYDSPGEETQVGGAIGGSIDSLKPRVYFPKGHQPSTFYSHGYAVGRSLFIESAIPDHIYSFATGELVATITPTPEDQDLYYSGYRFHEDTLFWVAGTARRSAVKVWTKEQGIFTLLDHDGDLTRSVRGFATDGVDMVWMEGRGRTNFNALTFDAYEDWTAKFTLDKATVNATKRRVHSVPRAAMGEQYAVGCGYAAIAALGPAAAEWGQTGFRLIRLSDRRSWPMLPESRAQKRELSFATPLGITCEHVYVEAWSHSATQAEVVRIRLDSLGEGVAAD